MRRASILLVSVFLVGCQGTSPGSPFSHHLSPKAEALAGDRAAPTVEARYGGVIRDAQAEQRMARIGLRLAQGTSEIKGAYCYRLLKSDKLNAVSLPGGRVYITRGLYCYLESDEQVAAVLAHEMAHIVTKDHFKPRCSNCAQAIKREQAADHLGARYLRRAGIDPEAMSEIVWIVRSAQPEGWSDIRIRSLMQNRG